MATLFLRPVGELSHVRVDVDRLGRVGLADAPLWALGLFSRPVVLDPRAYLGSGVGVLGVRSGLRELVPAGVGQQSRHRIRARGILRRTLRSVARMDGRAAPAIRIRVRQQQLHWRNPHRRPYSRRVRRPRHFASVPWTRRAETGCADLRCRNPQGWCQPGAGAGPGAGDGRFAVQGGTDSRSRATVRGGAPEAPRAGAADDAAAVFRSRRPSSASSGVGYPPAARAPRESADVIGRMGTPREPAGSSRSADTADIPVHRGAVPRQPDGSQAAPSPDRGRLEVPGYRRAPTASQTAPGVAAPADRSWSAPDRQLPSRPSGNDRGPVVYRGGRVSPERQVPDGGAADARRYRRLSRSSARRRRERFTPVVPILPGSHRAPRHTSASASASAGTRARAPAGRRPITGRGTFARRSAFSRRITLSR